MNKTLEEATSLIESMASHDFSWSNERTVHPSQAGVHQLRTQDAVAAQVDIFAKQLTQMMLNSNNTSVV